MKIRQSLAVATAGVVFGVVAVVGTPSLASTPAQPNEPQPSYRCGDNVVNSKRDLYYRSCYGGGSRRADVANGSDGPCKYIAGGTTVHLVHIYDTGPLNEVYVRGSKAC